ncbi:unnamed protein product [Bemisia tabaci]|uniref:C2H2-type domain-containing protein n=1 Tax=Bemisia tabaci TaxID=7038 RepID=A0A9P0G0A6_BEMTA|nr:unnamed protein product [Bemisia tabaci]
MSYRGRGSYRGSSSRGGWGGESRGRSNRNGGHFFKEPSSSYKPYHGEREKFPSYRGDSHYSSRGRQHDSYTPRHERSHRGPSPDRKRMRTDSYTSVGSSHSRDYDSYGGRYGESSSNDRMVFREERRSLRGDRRSSEYPVHRKSGPPSHTETSPRFTSPRGGRGSRGSYRGRSSSFRGSVRPSYTKPISTPRSSSTVMRRYRPEYSTRGRSALLKKRKELEIIQKYKRLKLQRLRLRKAFLAKKTLGSKGDDSNEEGKEEAEEDADENEEIEEEIEEEVEEEVEEEAKEEEIETETTDKDKEKEKDDEGEEKPKPKVKKVVKKIVKKVVKKPAKAPTANGPVKKEGASEKSSKDAPAEKKVTKESSPVRKTATGRPFIRLECPQCKDRYVTFRDYEDHLRSGKHKSAMRNRSMELKKKLARIRLQQRDEQREIDEKLAAEGETFKTMFCETCKLIFKQRRMDHNDSDNHKKTKILLNPYCKCCRIRFLSPMAFEAHIASLDHIQHKARSEAYEEKMKQKKAKEQEEGKAVNMDNFMVLDSVGSGDESGDDTEEKTENKDGTTEEGKEVKKKKSKPINLGSEFCRKIEVYYCELCRMQVPRSTTLEMALALHCRNRLHLKKFIRARDDKALRKKAEKIHREKEESEKKEKKVVEVKKEKMDGEISENISVEERPIKQEEECDSEAEGKFWKEIESDLPDISDDVENKSSDDEDGSNSRYDRFNTNNDDKPLKTDSCTVDEKETTEEAAVEEEEETKEETESKEVET